jgi:hypothetical protein
VHRAAIATRVFSTVVLAVTGAQDRAGSGQHQGCRFAHAICLYNDVDDARRLLTANRLQVRATPEPWTRFDHLRQP